MGVVAAITLMTLCSFAAADPPSQQDCGLCSQIYIMNQYCTNQLSPSSIASLPRRGKAGPQCPPGVVNKTELNETIAGIFSDMKRSMEENFTRWMDSAASEMNHMKAEIRFLKRFASFESCEDGERFLAGNGGVVTLVRDGNFYEVYCDMATDGGNWIVFQRRTDGSVDFYRTWEEYATGFGNKAGEFWLGLETVHQLTQNGSYELRVDLTDWDGSTRYAKYGIFSISGRSDGYRLTVGEYSGNAGDSLNYHYGQRFSTKDKERSWRNCATLFRAAWWFGSCGFSSLNGRYNDTSGGVFWYHWGNRYYYSLKAAEMKFRKK